ncbi:hypothetical protein BDP27DRAFT_538115 [Rhodocollybia butyracea]|uniref:Uncharacterized protein n=1 Tax=Rhodocollybia butyracea TaxID=206335 RepID=A0A9P5P8T8_9AGAR|nr:hypothetical protein BDP27DRAFT_538115 [Rhodocollybia butyracea]
MSSQVCFPESEYTFLQRTLNESLVVPIAIELFLYGIFLTLFSSSLYIFRAKLMPGKLYVIGTAIFFITATVSVALDLAWRSGDSDRATITGLSPTAFGFKADEKVVSIQAGPYYIFILAGMFSDAILIHRCYHLWNSRKSVVAVPFFGLIAIFIAWIVFEALLDIGQFFDQVYIAATLLENLVLTGLMVGRVWWLHRRTNRISIDNKTNTTASQRFAGTLLQSGALNSVFLIFSIITIFGTGSFQILTPCALTQIGISATLLAVSIALGLGFDPQFGMLDEENQSQAGLVLRNLESRRQDSVPPNKDTV